MDQHMHYRSPRSEKGAERLFEEIMTKIHISLIISNVEHLLMGFLAVCIPSLEKCQFGFSAHFVIRLVFIFYY